MACVKQARVVVANAESWLRAANVPSPMAGTALVTPPRPRTTVNVGDLLAKVGDLELPQVRAFIDQPDFSPFRRVRR